MDRKGELLKIFKGLDKNVLTIVEPMIDDLVFIEDQLRDLRAKPFLKVHPKDPTIQKATPASRMYKDLQAQERDIVRILCSQLHKGANEETESPLRAYLRELEG